MSVRSALGGLGASTLAWLIARSQSGWALDLSHHQAGLAVAAGAWQQETSCGWPELHSSNITPETLISLATEIDGVRFFSGGIPPPMQLISELIFHIGESVPVVVDGDLPGSQSIVITTNQPVAWETALAMRPDALVIRQQIGGLIPQVMRSETSLPIFITKEDRALRRAGELGLGIPPKSRLAEVAKSVWLWSNPPR